MLSAMVVVLVVWLVFLVFLVALVAVGEFVARRHRNDPLERIWRLDSRDPEESRQR